MTKIYNGVDLKDGIGVQFVGVYVLNWKKEWGKPEIGFVEPEESNYVCPFCGEEDFDLIGLKNHFKKGWCEKFNDIENI